MLTVNTCGVGILALHLLRLARNRNTEIGYIGDVLQRNKALYQYLRLIEWLLVNAKIKMIISLYRLEMNFLKIVQAASHVRSAACSVSISITSALIINNLRIYFKNNRI